MQVGCARGPGQGGRPGPALNALYSAQLLEKLPPMTAMGSERITMHSSMEMPATNLQPENGNKGQDKDMGQEARATHFHAVSSRRGRGRLWGRG
jgi:hypothetical protein